MLQSPSVTAIGAMSRIVVSTQPSMKVSDISMLGVMAILLHIEPVFHSSSRRVYSALGAGEAALLIAQMVRTPARLAGVVSLILHWH